MLERKYANRSEWKRVVERRYVQAYLDTNEFKGYVTLLKVIKVREPLHVQYNEKLVCIVDAGYSWLQHFPTNEQYSVTTMFNAEGEIVQWYIDICKENGIENGVPWIDDLYLDIIVLPTGEVILLDADELDEALSVGIIDKHLYELAWVEANRLIDLIKSEEFNLIKLSREHKEILSNKI